MRQSAPWLDPFWKGIIFLGIVVAFAIAHSMLPTWSDARFFDGSSIMGIVWSVVGIVAGGYFLLSLLFALSYSPAPSVSDAELPTCTLIIPAFNEGPMVRIALLSALRNNYPVDKFHIIAIDDGSQDDTWTHMSAVQREFPSRVTAIRLEKNGGKREALRTGFLQARGEFVVTVDSDSRIDRQAIRNIVAPMVTDPEIGAVAGKVLVLNRYENLITRLLAARLFITFDLMRAAQSRFGAVLCTPGALSAYRREAVLRVLESWSTQTFLGSPCTIAEDRALTTWLMRTGYRAVYQSSALVHTIMPSDLQKLFRMLLRWERGNIREDFVMFPVLFTRWRSRDRWWPTFEIMFQIVQMPLGYLAVATTIGHCIKHPAVLLLVGAVSVITALVQSLYCLRSERGTDFLYGVGYACFAFIGLQWIFPYSCLTLKDGRWMTR